MSKGLEALNSLFETMPFAFLESNTMKELRIIEKELKRLEEHDNGAYVSIHINRYNELCDKEEALKIIIEKQVNVSALLTLDDFAEYNEYCSVVGGCKSLTQEEYNLLKEVLNA